MKVIRSKYKDVITQKNIGYRMKKTARWTWRKKSALLPRVSNVTELKLESGCLL